MAMDRVAMDRGSIGDSLLYVLATKTWRPREGGGQENVAATKTWRLRIRAGEEFDLRRGGSLF